MQYQADVQQAEQRYRDLTKKILTQKLYYQKTTPADIAKLLGAKQPLQLQPDGPNFIAHWTDPVSHSNVRIKFDSNMHSTGRGAGFSTSNVPRPGPRSSAAAQQSLTTLGLLLCPTPGGMFTPLPYLIWIPLLIAYFRAPHRRGLLCYLLACVAVVFPLIWVMAGFSTLNLINLFSYDPNGWGAIMFVVTAIVLGLGCVCDRITDPLTCKHCGYSLKGNISGVCPECGAAVESVASTTVL